MQKRGSTKQLLNWKWKRENTFPYNSKMIEHEELIKRASNHKMKANIGAEEHLAE